jgi:hypothetical protein
MSAISVRLPTSLHRHLRDLAEREDVSMNQLISSAVGEKLAALMTEDYLSRAARGTRKAYDAVLRRIADVKGKPAPRKRPSSRGRRKTR